MDHALHIDFEPRIGRRHITLTEEGTEYAMPEGIKGQPIIQRPSYDAGKYAVDSYQIAVRNGDCSIHLLVERPKNGCRTETGFNHSVRGTILNAILMDGGNDGWGGSSGKTGAHLKSVITQISKDYLQLEGGQVTKLEYIKFDSWVITHWDADHWKGVMQMLVEDIVANEKNDPPKYFKYSYNKENKLVPKTTMYCPNWIKIPETFPVETKIAEDELKSKPQYLHLEGIEENGEGVAHVEYFDGPRKSCILSSVVFGPGKLLCVDLFTGERPFKNIEPTLRSDLTHKSALSKLFDLEFLASTMNIEVQDQQNHRPRFYCIAAAGLLLGQGQLTQRDLDDAISKAGNYLLDIPEDVDIQDDEDKVTYGENRREPDEGLNQTVNRAAGNKKDGDNTWANLSSLISVLHFCNTRHVSLYWAGDATESLELALVNGNFFPSNSRYPVKVAKWSHHGAKHSNPEKVFNILNPERCIVSAGVMHGYTHPHPLVINRFLTNLMKTNQKARDDFVYGVQYPSWLLKEKMAKSRKECLREEEQWNLISPIKRNMLYSPINLFRPQGGSFVDANGADHPDSPTGKTKILYNLIESSFDPMKDGHIEIFASHGGTFEEYYRGNEIQESHLLPAKPKKGKSKDVLRNPFHEANVEARKKYNFFADEVPNPDADQWLRNATTNLDGTFRNQGMKERHNTESENNHNYSFGGATNSGYDNRYDRSDFQNQGLNVHNPMLKDGGMAVETSQGFSNNNQKIMSHFGRDGSFLNSNNDPNLWRQGNTFLPNNFGNGSKLNFAPSPNQNFNNNGFSDATFQLQNPPQNWHNPYSPYFGALNPTQYQYDNQPTFNPPQFPVQPNPFEHNQMGYPQKYPPTAQGMQNHKSIGIKNDTSNVTKNQYDNQSPFNPPQFRLQPNTFKHNWSRYPQKHPPTAGGMGNNKPVEKEEGFDDAEMEEYMSRRKRFHPNDRPFQN